VRRPLSSVLLLPLPLLLLAGCKIAGSGPSSSPPYRPPPPGMATCTGSTLCLRVVPMRPGPPLPGRLVVAWIPINDDDPRGQPEIAFEAPFYGNERTVVIPYSAIRPPRYMELFPPCFERRPECDRPAGVATGYVLVIPSTGAPATPQSVGKGTITAVGRLVVGYGTQPIAPGGPLRDVFPAGIAGGMAPYAPIPPPQGGHDRAFLNPQGTWFDLVTCTPADPRCDLPYPNLT